MWLWMSSSSWKTWKVSIFFQGIKNSLLWLRIPSCSVMRDEVLAGSQADADHAQIILPRHTALCKGALHSFEKVVRHVLRTKGFLRIFDGFFSKTKESLFLKVKSPLALLKSSRWNIPIRFQCLQTSAFNKAQYDQSKYGLCEGECGCFEF